jgi:hypothetical protein
MVAARSALTERFRHGQGTYLVHADAPGSQAADNDGPIVVVGVVHAACLALALIDDHA